MTDRTPTVSRRPGDHVALTGPAGTATYRFGGLPKACVHPLTTPTGHRLSGFEMSDHVWHRGLWFTIKFVNGTNYWEEHEPYGVQVHTADPTVEKIGDTSARIRAEIQWTSAATGMVFRETRTLTRHVLDDVVVAIDWSAALRAEQDLTLDRTPYTTWGGYGGLSFRSTREFHKAHLMLPGGAEVQGLAGQPGPWVVMQGLLDGGKDLKAAIGMVDHPSNPRGPSPWYCKVGPEVNFMNAAFLFHQPMTVAKGEMLRFNYRVLYRDGHWTADAFDALADAYRATTPEAL